MTDPQLRQLLLRRLPADETARLEESILLEEGVAERLCSEEFDLLEDYAASRLNAEDAADVERYLLASEQSRHSLRVARALQEVASEVRVRHDVPAAAVSAVARRRRTPWVAGVSVLLAACLLIAVYVPPWRTQAPLGAVPSSLPPVTLPVISLMADVNRGPRPVLALPSDGDAVRLQAEVPDPTAARYSLTIQDNDGRRLFAARALEVRTAGRYRFVETVVPVAALGPGDRTLSLTDSDAAADAPTQFEWRVTGILHRP